MPQESKVIPLGQAGVGWTVLATPAVAVVVVTQGWVKYTIGAVEQTN